MGEAKNNPRSPQFVDRNPPEHIVAAQLIAEIRPTKAWSDANPAVDGETNEALCPLDEVEVAVGILGQYAEGSAIIPQQKWAHGQTPMLVIATVPFLVWQAKVKAAAPDQPWRTTSGPSIEEKH